MTYRPTYEIFIGWARFTHWWKQFAFYSSEMLFYCWKPWVLRLLSECLSLSFLRTQNSLSLIHILNKSELVNLCSHREVLVNDNSASSLMCKRRWDVGYRWSAHKTYMWYLGRIIITYSIQKDTAYVATYKSTDHWGS